jgi:hypothetical protein
VSPSPTFFQLSIDRGECHAFYAYDVAHSIALDALRLRVAELGELQPPPHRPARGGAPRIEVEPTPLRLVQHASAIAVGAYRTQESVDVELYDFGAVSIGYTIPLTGLTSGLLDLSCALVENAALLADSRARAERILHTIAPAVTRPSLHPAVEDYVVFVLEALDTAADPTAVVESSPGDVARVLRSERRPLSGQEIGDSLAARVAYGERDLALFDWNAAILFDAEPDDTLAILEFANIELLEMRFLDARLDLALDEAYVVTSRERGGAGLLRSSGGERFRIAQLQVDSAFLFGRVSNALKLVGDQYLARVYRALAQRFHLSEWDAGIQRKLETLESLYEKLTDRAATRRMEILEWIIIALFVVSIVVSLVPVGK